MVLVGRAVGIVEVEEVHRHFVEALKDVSSWVEVLVVVVQVGILRIVLVGLRVAEAVGIVQVVASGQLEVPSCDDLLAMEEWALVEVVEAFPVVEVDVTWTWEVAEVVGCLRD